jgi:hypothetical protein
MTTRRHQRRRSTRSRLGHGLLASSAALLRCRCVAVTPSGARPRPAAAEPTRPLIASSRTGARSVRDAASILIFSTALAETVFLDEHRRAPQRRSTVAAQPAGETAACGGGGKNRKPAAHGNPGVTRLPFCFTYYFGSGPGGSDLLRRNRRRWVRIQPTLTASARREFRSHAMASPTPSAAQPSRSRANAPPSAKALRGAATVAIREKTVQPTARE